MSRLRLGTRDLSLTRDIIRIRTMDTGHPVAIVTGGGRNLGKTIAMRLARDGYDLVRAGLEREALEHTAADIVTLGRRVLSVVTDVSREDQVSAMAGRTRDLFGRVDVLVNNAGIIGPHAPVARIALADWNEVMAVNLTGAFLCARAVI